MVATDLATPIVLRIAAVAAAELGIDAGILSVGAGSTVATFGVGLAVAVVVDYVLAAVLKASGYDPEAGIAQKVRDALERLETALVEGGSGKPGLRAELEALRQQRSGLRQRAVLALVEGGAR
jgi:hypothetical protein